MDFQSQLARLVEGALAAEGAGLKGVSVAELLEVPPASNLGDYALPCFSLARVLRKAPAAIAAGLAERIAGSVAPSWLARVEAVKGYLNFHLDWAQAARDVLPAVLGEAEGYGRSPVRDDAPIVLDFSSPNIARPLGVHHLRTTVLGHSLARIYRWLGQRVVRLNYLGDWGTQFGKLIVAWHLWGNEERLAAEPTRELLRIYVRFHEEAERRPELEEQARAWFKRLEDGDPEARALWERFRAASLADFRRVYEALGISFDELSGESFYNGKMGEVIAELAAKGLLTESEGARVVPLGDDLPPCLIQKRDGATLYATRDIAAAIDRWERFHFQRLLYVVAAQQSLHFRQVFGVLRRMGLSWVDRCEHVAFGMVTFPDGVMSTRKGRVIPAEDLLTEAVQRVQSIIAERNPGLQDKERVARQVGVGAVIFANLRQGRLKDVPFDWEATLSFDGDAAPYVQYTHARACSVLRKAGIPLGPGPGGETRPEVPAPLGDADFGLLREGEEHALVRALLAFPAAVRDAAAHREPAVLARYVLDLSNAFNTFYHAHRILGAGEGLEGARLGLTLAVRRVAASGLYLLGIEAPEEM